MNMEITACLCELSLGLPRPCQGMAVTAVELARNVAADAHTRGCRTCVGHCAGDVGSAGSAVVHSRNCRRNPPVGVGGIGVTEGKVVNKTGEGHGGAELRELSGGGSAGNIVARCDSN